MVVNSKIALRTSGDVKFAKLSKTRRNRYPEALQAPIKSESIECTPKVTMFLAKKPSRGSRFRSFDNYNDLITPHASVRHDKVKMSSACSSGFGTLSDISSSSSNNSFSGFLHFTSIKTNLFRNSVQVHPLSKQHSINVRIDTKISLPPRALPSLGWVDGRDLWSLLMDNESKYFKDLNYFRRQSEIVPHSRSVLVGWMIEVCELYNLQSDTFYYAVDYVDRYLSRVDDVPICSLQLLGTTSLFIASKLVEVSPLSVNDFVHLTDGACSAEDVVIQEGIILNELNWNLTPFSPLNWLELYLHIASYDCSFSNKTVHDVHYKGPLTRMRSLKTSNSAISDKLFLNIMLPRDILQPMLKVLECVIQDINSLRFSYSVIAATVVHIMTDFDIFEITGIGCFDVSTCAKWIKQNFDPNYYETAFPTDLESCFLKSHLKNQNENEILFDDKENVEMNL